MADSSDDSVRATINGFVGSFADRTSPGKEIYPASVTDRLQSVDLDIRALTNLDLAAGRGYAAVASQAIDCRFSRVMEILRQPGIPMTLVSNVKTLRNTEKLSAVSEAEFTIKTAIKVPVVSDFITEVKLHFFEKQDRGILEWKQISDFGQLTYNHGMAIVEANGEKTRITVLGIHIIKTSDKVPWLGRGTAKTFAKNHYGNFVAAFKKVIEPKCVSKKDTK